MSNLQNCATIRCVVGNFLQQQYKMNKDRKYISFLGLLQQITTNYKQHKHILLHFCRPEVWNPGVRRDILLPKAPEKIPFLRLSSFHWLQEFLDLWQYNANLCLFIHMAISSLSPFCNICTGFMVYPDPRPSLLKILDLITSAKILSSK